MKSGYFIIKKERNIEGFRAEMLLAYNAAK